MCICISLSAYSTLFCLFGPKISIILFHPDKNVRKLTMNSAQYKRPFKPVSSMASVDGRQNTTGGTYNGQQTDGGSGGPMSTTSNVLNPGEWKKKQQTAARQRSSSAASAANLPPNKEAFRKCGGCCCLEFHWRCQTISPCQQLNQLAATASSFSWRDCGPTCCWLAIKRWLSQCCALGELGTTTSAVLELDSLDLAAQVSSSSSHD